MKKDVKELLERYLSQDSKEQKNAYDDEIRAEADLCAECCSCCRISFVTNRKAFFYNCLDSFQNQNDYPI